MVAVDGHPGGPVAEHLDLERARGLQDEGPVEQRVRRHRGQDEGLKIARQSLSTQVKMLSHLAQFPDAIPRPIPVKLPS